MRAGGGEEKKKTNMRIETLEGGVEVKKRKSVKEMYGNKQKKNPGLMREWMSGCLTTTGSWLPVSSR